MAAPYTWFQTACSSLALGMATVACGDDLVSAEDEADVSDAADTSQESEETGAELPAHCEGADAWAGPSEDNFAVIQGMLSAASEGDVICLAAGDYGGLSTQLSISIDNLTLRGAGKDKTILDFSEQSASEPLEDAGVMVLDGTDGVTIEDLQIEDTAGEGITVYAATNTTISRVAVQWSSEDPTGHGTYAIELYVASDAVVSGSTLTGARSAGIVAFSGIRLAVHDNLVSQSTAGVAITAVTDVWVFANELHDNAMGVMVYDFLHFDGIIGANTRIYENDIHDNNLEDWPISPESWVDSDLPSGVGVALLSASLVEIDHNELDSHDTAGVVMLNTAGELFETTEHPSASAVNRGIHVHDNTLTNIGYDPSEPVASLLEGNDGPGLLWDGVRPQCDDELEQGQEICVQNNTGDASTLFNLDQCGLYGGPNTDTAVLDCEGVTLPDWPG
ncbi:right-handed parallel beta-helix repeat-containing protein [Pseudenhygromyxa sp. WMMC2535]|uniref:parallel beta-helix domain-containing protein n=1 Tax=Pseudenhygromyxa sp. WMMC2535 TaxID=2712867 RepID=UPI0015559038|nr:parallel beta-helix domain-containing protein [Pseudenhygromyxa sp. WMMC2535]NVB42874.1 right-handed parallel beta-helix repeat-containing protein [Pseudenhygromyxa sp. WMMC2535]